MVRLQRILLVLMLLLVALRPARAEGEPTRLRDVVYGRKYGMALTMDVLKPAKPSGIGVLFMVSGGWSSDIAMAGNGELVRPFIKHGQTVFLICHGSQPKFTIDEIVPDIHRAVRFIRTHAKEYGVDPDRLGISGASSGGHLSTTIGTMGKPGDPNAKDPVDRASSRVGAVACFFPPLDLVDYGEKGHNFLEFKAVEFVWHLFPVKNKPQEEQNQFLRTYSPYYAASKDTPPTLILQGDKDPLVPHEQAERFMAKLEELKVPHQLIMRPGQGHGWPGLDKDVDLLADWFDKYLPDKSKT